jgi:hypothetical protein
LGTLELKRIKTHFQSSDQSRDQVDCIYDVINMSHTFDDSLMSHKNRLADVIFEIFEESKNEKTEPRDPGEHVTSGYFRSAKCDFRFNQSVGLGLLPVKFVDKDYKRMGRVVVSVVMN